MPSVTVRNLADATHRGLKLRAALNGRSTEAEIRAILDTAVQPSLLMGTALVEIGRRLGGADLKLKRDKRPVKLAIFE